MKFYPFEEIERACPCERFVREVLGAEVVNGRCRAAWRGGDGLNVSLSGPSWYDHRAKAGGGVVQLCAVAKFGGDIQRAQEFLGGWLGLAHAGETVRIAYDYRKSPRYAALVDGGYAEAAVYNYRDASGSVVHRVVRMEHPAKKKEFLQCTPWAASLRGVDTVLYNLPAIAASTWAVVVEGEKDADTLIRLGLPATTCNNGADHWRASYTEALRGKDVVVCRDNDEAGRDHARLVLRSLAGAARSLRSVCPSRAPRGDVTDWLASEGGDLAKFRAMIKAAPAISPEEARWDDAEYALYRAKKANEKEFSNAFTEFRRPDGAGKKERAVFLPRTQREMIADVHERFLGFPRRLGESTLFDDDRDSGRVELLPSASAVVSWIGEKSKRAVVWRRGDGFSTKEELFTALVRNAPRYEKISKTPGWPPRPDVYYPRCASVSPSPGGEALRGLMGFFLPESDTDACLAESLICGMMYYRPGVQRPCWIIDSHDGQASGKTTLAELACYLYQCSPIKTSPQELARDYKELTKRLVSVTGRNSLMLLVDNVRGTFDVSAFSDLVTCFSISGKAPYGIGEESRPNDLTYVVTSNSANIGSDMASRSIILYLRRPPAGGPPAWKSAVMEYIDRRRREILGDIHALLSSEPAFAVAPATRFPEFESDVIRKVAGSRERYDRVIEALLSSRADADVDAERAVLAAEAMRDGIRSALEMDPESCCVFLRSAVVNAWTRSIGVDIQDVRNMANTGKISCVHKSIRRYPRGHGSPLMASGCLFFGRRIPADGVVRVPILTVSGADRSVKVAGYAEDRILAAELFGRRVEEASAPPFPAAPELPFGRPEGGA